MATSAWVRSKTGSAVKLTAALEAALTAAGWTVTSEVIDAALRLHAVRHELRGRQRSEVCAILIGLQRRPIGYQYDYEGKQAILMATSGVRLGATGH